MSLSNIAKRYLEYLETNDIDNIIKLFSESGLVNSPVYGVMPAAKFYKTLSADTSASKLKLHGIFEEDKAERIAIYFNYEWTLANFEKVNFDVVDILSFDANSNIESLHIIYDTVKSKVLVDKLKATK